MPHALGNSRLLCSDSEPRRSILLEQSLREYIYSRPGALPLLMHLFSAHTLCCQTLDACTARVRGSGDQNPSSRYGEFVTPPERLTSTTRYRLLIKKSIVSRRTGLRSDHNHEHSGANLTASSHFGYRRNRLETSNRRVGVCSPSLPCCGVRQHLLVTTSPGRAERGTGGNEAKSERPPSRC